MYDLKVIVIGAGIGGLTAGIALQQAGFRVEIYDRVRDLRPVGAGISLWSNGIKVLNRLGLGREIAAVGGQMDKLEYRYKNGHLLNDIDFWPLFTQVGQRPYPVSRADLQRILLASFGGEVTLGSRCVAVEETDRCVTAIFEDGSRAQGDLIVAADGIRSILRTYVLGQEVAPQYAGYVNWNGLLPASEDLVGDRSWVVYVGDHQRASLMPVARNQLLYFFFDVPLGIEAEAPPPEQYPQELAQYFAGWAEPVQRMIARLDPQKTTRAKIHDVGPVSKMVRGRVALLGDAAHATCPDLGQGGCQAMEDAWILAQYLVTTNISVEDALLRYEAERKDRANAVVRKARKRAETIHGKDPAVTEQWYRQLAEESPNSVREAIANVILAGPLH